MGTVITRPSHSGRATCIAASDGLKPRADAFHVARGIPQQIAWISGAPITSKGAPYPGTGTRSGEFNVKTGKLTVLTMISGESGNRRSASGTPVASQSRNEL